MRVGFVIAITCVFLGCQDKPHAGAVEASAPAASIASPPKAPLTPTCDADALWFDGGVSSPADFEAALRTWSPECRERALRATCAAYCDEVISDRIISASASSEEKKQATRVRLELNVAALSTAKELLRRARDIQRYALSIRGTPRSVDPSCMTRMRSDLAKIDALREDAKVLPIPLGGMSIGLFAGSARTCVSCGDDLASDCNDMAEPLKDMSDNLADLDKLVASDKRALAARR